MISYANITNTLYNRNKVGYNQKKAAYSAAFSILFLNNLNWSTVG